MRAKLLSLFLFSFLFLTYLNCIDTNVNASITGNYYYFDFTTDIGLTQYNQTDNGVEWLQLRNIVGFSTTGSKWSTSSVSSSYLNFTENTNNINFSTLIENSDGATAKCNWYIYLNTSSNNIFYLKFTDTDGFSSTITYQLYDDDNNLLTSSIGYGYCNVSFIQLNKSVHIFTTGLNFWFTFENFNYPTHIYTKNIVSTTHYTLSFDNFYFKWNTGELLNPWEIVSDYKTGSVIGSGSYISLSGATFLPECEQRYNGNIPITLKQFSLAIGSLSEVSGHTVQLNINGVSIGSYNTITTYSTDRYVLTWQNINKDYTISDYPLLFEMYFQVNSLDTIEFIYNCGDINEDGISDCRMDYGSYLMDNVYNGVLRDGDIAHKIWYNVSTTDIENPYGNLTGNNTLVTPWDYGYTDIFERYIEEKINMFSNVYLNALDLYVAPEQITSISNDLSNYRLYINGDYKGNPSYIFGATAEYEGSHNYYIIRWLNLQSTLTDSDLYIELYSINHDTPVFWNPFAWRYWSLCTSSVHNSLSNDFFYHSNQLLFGNGQIDGSEYSKTVRFALYYTSFIPNPNVNDTISLQPSTKTVYKELENINFAITLSTLAPNTYMQIWKDGVRLDVQDYGGNGKLIDNYYKVSSFCPDNDTSTGVYNATINRNGVQLDEVIFTVIDRPDNEYDQLIYTYPNPSKMWEQFTLGWLYDKTEYNNNNGAILFSESPIFNPYSNIIVSDISENGTMSYSFPHQKEYYLFLCTYRNSTYYPIYTHVHRVGDSTYNDITVRNSEIALSPQSDGTQKATQKFIGQHSYLGSNVYVKDNGQIIQTVGTSVFFNFDIDYFTTGYHDIQLIVALATGELQLANTSFVVLAYNENQNNGLPSVPSGIGALVGFIIVLMCALIPFVICVKAQTEITVNFGITVLFASLGIVLSVLLGFWAWWTLFFVLMLAIITMFIVYIQNKN